jgi:hypothetical protein
MRREKKKKKKKKKKACKGTSCARAAAAAVVTRTPEIQLALHERVDKVGRALNDFGAQADHVGAHGGVERRGKVCNRKKKNLKKNVLSEDSRRNE